MAQDDTAIKGKLVKVGKSGLVTRSDSGVCRVVATVLYGDVTFRVEDSGTALAA